MVNNSKTLLHLLDFWAEKKSSSIAYRFLSHRGIEIEALDFESLAISARNIGANLIDSGLNSSDRVILSCKSPEKFVPTFFGILFAGGIPVPAPLVNTRNPYIINNIVSSCSPSMILTDIEYKDKNGSFSKDLKWQSCQKLLNTTSSLRISQKADPESMAFLQYTSGSTRLPKGVKITNRNILSNLEMMKNSFLIDEKSIFMNWLPLYHDMGLVGTVLQPLYLGTTSVLMPPAAFVEKPALWLKNISRYRAHTSGSPDFGYRLCVQKIKPTDLEGVDLSCWKVAFNGAEPVNFSTLNEFDEAFSKYGFSNSSLVASYGMAEATLLISNSMARRPPNSIALSRKTLGEGIVSVANKKETNIVRVISVGSPPSGVTLEIVDPSSKKQSPPSSVGEVWVAGPNVSSGYWGGELNDNILTDFPELRFLRTGDLGFIKDDELFIVGRTKNIVIKQGRNHHVHDIEFISQHAHPALIHGKSAVFEASSEEFNQIFGEIPNTAGNFVVMALEISRQTDKSEYTTIIQSVLEQVFATHELVIDGIVLVRYKSIQVTTSGKIQRGRTKELLVSRNRLTLFTHINEEDTSFVSPNFSNSDCLDPQFIANQLKQVITDTLKIDAVIMSETNSLTEFGVNSLEAMHLKHRIEVTFDITLPILSLLNDSLKKLTADCLPLILQSRRIKKHSHEVNRKSYETVDYQFKQLPISVGQKAMAFGHFTQSSLQQLGFVATCSTQNKDILIRALNYVVSQQPALQTKFTLKDGEISSTYSPSLKPFLQETSDTGSEHEREKLFAEALELPFDLNQGPIRGFLTVSNENKCYLLVNIHHIASDFWSITTFAHSLAHAFDRLCNGLTLKPYNNLAPYLEHLAFKLKSDDDSKSLDYWRNNFKEFKKKPLPIDYTPIDSIQPVSLHSSVSFVEVPLDANSFKQIANDNQTTCFSAYLTILMIAVSRWIASEEITIGVPIADRENPSMNLVNGYFVNPLPIKASTHRCSIQELFLQVKHQLSVAIDNKNISLATIIKAINPERKKGDHPLFDVTAIHLKVPPAVDPAFIELAKPKGSYITPVTGLGLSTQAIQFQPLEQDIEALLIESDHEISAYLRYDHSKFSKNSISLVTSQMAQCIETAKSNPAKLIDSLDFWPNRSNFLEYSVLQESKLRPYLWAHSLTKPFIGFAKNDPDAVAICFGDQSVTYGQLYGKINDIQAEMQQNIKHLNGCRIAICVDNPILQIASMFAVLKSGATFLAIDSGVPNARVKLMLQGINPTIILYDCLERFDQQIGLDNPADRKKININSIDSGKAVAEIDIRPNSFAYIVYTSGSSGIPKGIRHSHQTLMQYITWQAETLNIMPGARVGQIASIGFDVSYCEIFGTLCFGATLVIPDRKRDLVPCNFLSWIKRKRISTIQIIPSLLRGVFKIEANPSLDPLETLATVGEALSPSLAGEILKYMNNKSRLINIYGPTECVAATFHCVTSSDLTQKVIPVGNPIEGRELLVLDENDVPCPKGSCGTVWIRSHFLSNGYLSSDGVNNTARFKELPEETANQTGLFNSGDLGRWRDDGKLEILGRIDNQIKLRGVRIELEEIEAVVESYPSVISSLTAVHCIGNENDKLIAYVESTADLEVLALRKFLLKHLPRQFVPDQIIKVKKLPFLANGKKDRQSIQLTPDLANNDSFSATNNLDEKLVNIWMEVLDVGDNTIDEKSNFFQMGGHSILAMQLLNQIEVEYGISIEIGVFFENPTAGALDLQLKEK